MDEAKYNRHRFDNHSAWLDREGRNKARREGRPLGHGFVPPTIYPLKPEGDPFYVQEAAFTSGLMVSRKYTHLDQSFPTEKERADPYHYPNHLEVSEGQHYMRHTRRSQNLEPSTWAPDPELAGVVSDDQIKMLVSSHLGEARQECDPKLMGVLFDETVRPAQSSIKDLNCDLSCTDLPLREGGSIARRLQTLPAASASSQPKKSDGGPKADRWGWCLGGRPAPSLQQRRMDSKEARVVKSQSLPQMPLSNTPSMLAGNLGGSGKEAFFGVHTREFGRNNTRMRGGKSAEIGYAGTFPEQDMEMYHGGPTSN